MTSDPSSGPAGGSCVIFAMASGFHDVGEGEIGRKVTGIADQMIVRFAAACGARARSEEHTSELQSLMRISYAVFCLKKKKTTKLINNRYLLSRVMQARSEKI